MALLEKYDSLPIKDHLGQVVELLNPPETSEDSLVVYNIPGSLRYVSLVSDPDMKKAQDRIKVRNYHEEIEPLEAAADGKSKASLAVIDDSTLKASQMMRHCSSPLLGVSGQSRKDGVFK